MALPFLPFLGGGWGQSAGVTHIDMLHMYNTHTVYVHTHTMYIDVHAFNYHLFCAFCLNRSLANNQITEIEDGTFADMPFLQAV